MYFAYNFTTSAAQMGVWGWQSRNYATDKLKIACLLVGTSPTTPTKSVSCSFNPKHLNSTVLTTTLQLEAKMLVDVKSNTSVWPMLATLCLLLPNPAQPRKSCQLCYVHIPNGKSERSIFNISIPDAIVVAVLLKEIITVPLGWCLSC